MLPNTGNGDRSIPEGDSLKGNNPSDANKSNDTASQKPHLIEDWREFRATLFAREQVMFCMAHRTVSFLNKGTTIV